MISPYEGNLPYIFVSYAHKDSREVFDLIEKLSVRGYRFWYDEGIEPGTEWPENIADHLLRADTVMAVITNNSMASVNCRREINFALSKNKPFLAVVLEKTDIPAGMELQLSSQQSVLRYNFKDENRFLDKVESCSAIEDCKIDAALADPGESSVPYTAPAAMKKKPDIRIIAGLGIILAALIIFFAISGKTGSNPSEGSGPAVNGGDISTTESVTGADAGSKAESVTGTDAGGTSGSATDASGSTVETTDGTKADSDASSGTARAADSQVESPAETSAMPDERWIYSVSTDDTSLIYTFRSGPRIVMPISWRNKITVMEENNYFVFYHASSKNSWHIEGYEHSGVLFSLGYSTTQDYRDFPSYSELGRNADGYYFLMYPTDVQGYLNNERIYSEYSEMWQEIDYVKNNSSLSID